MVTIIIMIILPLKVHMMMPSLLYNNPLQKIVILDNVMLQTHLPTQLIHVKKLLAIKRV